MSNKGCFGKNDFYGMWSAIFLIDYWIDRFVLYDFAESNEWVRAWNARNRSSCS